MLVCACVCVLVFSELHLTVNQMFAWSVSLKEPGGDLQCFLFLDRLHPMLPFLFRDGREDLRPLIVKWVTMLMPICSKT